LSRRRMAATTRTGTDPNTRPACPFSRGARWLVCVGPPTVRDVTWKPRAERGHRVRSDAIAPEQGSHYVPDGTVHAVDDQTGEVACGFDGELIEIEAAWDSPAFANVKCADCEQELARRMRVC
jgi:hypothetical protein